MDILQPSSYDYVLVLSFSFYFIWHKLSFTSLYKARLKQKAKKKYTAELEDRDTQSDDEVTKLMEDPSGSFELTPVCRWSNIHRNDLENVLPFLMAVSIYQNAGLPQLFLGIILIILFSYSRIAHTVMYANAIQPWRSIFFMVGLFCNLILSIWGASSMTISNMGTFTSRNYNPVVFQWVYTVLVFKIYLIHFFTYLSRLKTGNFASPEDRRPGLVQERGDTVKLVERYLNLARNDMENILPFFIASFLWQQIVGESAPAAVSLGGSILAVCFCFSRVMHTACYMIGSQPWRFIFYLMGVVVTIIMLIWNITYTIKSEPDSFYIVKVSVVACWSFLALKMYFIAAATEVTRVNTGTMAAPEDSLFSFKKVKGDEGGKMRVEHLLSCHRDDLQFLLPLAVSTLLLFPWGLRAIQGTIDIWGITMFFVFFTLVRTFHSVVYMWGTQPGHSVWQAMGFILGHLSLFALLYWVFIRIVLDTFGIKLD